MRHIEIPIPDGASDAQIERAIDSAIQSCALRITLRGSLKQHPGCIHWHVKNVQEKGTLELTWWPRERRAWFTIQSGRAAAWIDLTIPTLLAAIQQGLSRDKA